MKTLSHVSILTFLSLIAASCSEGVEPAELNWFELCEIAEDAQTSIEEKKASIRFISGVGEKQIRTSEDGIFIILKSQFVRESGFYLSMSGRKLNSEGSDPSYVHIERCAHRYEIKG